MVYRNVETSTWDDPKVRGLPPLGKLLWQYLLTNRHTHVSGIYVLPPVLGQYETGLTGADWDTLSDTLSRAGLAHFDPARDVVWVVNMFRYQGRGEKHERSAASQLGTLHNSPLIRDFCAKYPAVKAWLTDGVLDGVSDIPSLARAKDQDQDQEQNQEDDDDRARGARPSSSSPNPLWSDTTQRVITEWEQVRGTQAYEDVDAIEAALEVWPEKDIVAKIRASRPYRPNGFQYITAALEKQARQGAATKPTRAPPARSKPEEDPYLKFANGGRG